MSFIRNGLHLSQLVIKNIQPKVFPVAQFSKDANILNILKQQDTIQYRPVARDKTNIIPVEVGIQYMQSEAYESTYGKDPVWKIFQRNFKGSIPPRRTRKTCIRHGMITTSSPCPLCRDEYLVVDYRNTELLKQFISEFTGEVIDPFKTNLCRRKHKHVCIAILKAKNYGLITFDLPVRHYDYSEYLEQKSQQPMSENKIHRENHVY